jgi:hypothetical protein
LLILCFQVESEAIAAEELLSAAKGICASQPQGLLQSLLRQVQQLFDIPHLEQLPAAMNKVRHEKHMHREGAGEAFLCAVVHCWCHSWSSCQQT